ncbi:transporter substrate-binding domain-containing protein [Desulfovibrio sp. JC022]|uniref:transporter substrate-binding domain-containing protein n=1 Tax=Desulfovibrio sp. JC022 TaxID=2593642 RepID=UPI0013D6DF7B|nr:transporter substrate-binding domain-containing protein [Desulfovibrio sp. JC022]NDV22718.1 transporter substrate-binding domain-containing protein [Desulfovibrio sp. JC022]
MSLKKSTSLFVTVMSLLTIIIFSGSVLASDLEQIKKRGVLRHLGIPYANFVTGNDTGLSVEVVKLFAEHLGVRYEFVKSDWSTLFGDLTGTMVKPKGNDVEFLERTPIKGDIISNGLTRLKWREKVINYSKPTFPTQVWCVARGGSSLRPIKPSGNVDQDIRTVKSMLKGKRVMGKQGTCLAPGLYGIDSRISTIINFPGSLNDIAPAVIKGEADVALLDVPDSLVALNKWPGKIKVIGPISPPQTMGAGFRKDSPELLKAFNEFYSELRQNGEYNKLIMKYYPAVFSYYKDFFKN